MKLLGLSLQKMDNGTPRIVQEENTYPKAILYPRVSLDQAIKIKYSHDYTGCLKKKVIELWHAIVR